MHTHSPGLRVLATILGLALSLFSGWASADPPSRVARLGFMSGAVSFSPAGEDDWVEATVNRPLTTGDRLWADAAARAEIQTGGAMIRLDADTGVSILNLDDGITQLQLTQGTLNVRVRSLAAGEVVEIDTPNLAFTLRQVGEYRIVVDPDGNATDIIVRRGQGEVYGEDASYLVDARQPYRFTGTSLRDYQRIGTPRLDDFDRWSAARDRRYDNSVSARYVSRDVLGYQDLDSNGSWRVDASYGNVWVPHRVATDWAPYRDGHWAWVDPWGWTWVDNAPWGFAVSHYGRWANLRGTWAWVPGPSRARAYYAPALVAFVGGDNFQLTISSVSVGAVAWFALGPREVYRPSHAASRTYFENVNRSNTVINTTVINNTYNTTNVTNVVYANRQVPGAVVAVPRTAFVQSQPVSRSAVRVSREMLASAPVENHASVAPTEKSVHGNAGRGGKPPERVFLRPAVARTAPPAVQASFATQEQQLKAKPGKPLDEGVRKQLPVVQARPAPVVKVVAPVQVATPAAVPAVPAVPASAAAGGRGPSEPRDKAKAPGQAPTAPPPVPQAGPVAPQPAASAPVPPAQGQRKGRPGTTPAVSVPPPVPVAVPTPAVVPPTPVVVPPTPAVVRPVPAAPPPAPVAASPPARQAPAQKEKPDSENARGAKKVDQPPPLAEPKPASTPPVPAAKTEPERGGGARNAESRPAPAAPTKPVPAKDTVRPEVAAVPAPAALPPVRAPANPVPGPVARPAEAPPVVAPRPPPAARPQAPGKAESRGQKPSPAASQPGDAAEDKEEQKREDKRKQKG